MFLVFALTIPASSASNIGGYFEPGGMYGGHAGYHYWLNYCPMCHHYGCLLKNPKGTHEGELTCSRCDADYDGCTGADKSGGGARAWLSYAKKTIKKKVPTNTTNVTRTNNTTQQPAEIKIKGIGGSLNLPIHIANNFLTERNILFGA